MRIGIHQQDALFRLAHVQAHLALETISHFRLIPHWKRPPCPGSSRIGQFCNRKVERITNLTNIRVAGWGWCAAAPNNSFITARDAGTGEIYALDWEAP